MNDLPTIDPADPVTVQELTGKESGIWRVITRDSSYVVDLDCVTITRIPGSTARPGVNDRTRPLRFPIECRVGTRGHWEMDPDPDQPMIDAFWQYSSVILRIELVGTPHEVA